MTKGDKRDSSRRTSRAKRHFLNGTQAAFRNSWRGIQQEKHVVADAAANQATAEQTEADKKAHEAAMAAHHAQKAKSVALAAGATTDKAIVARQAASTTTLGEKGSV